MPDARSGCGWLAAVGKKKKKVNACQLGDRGKEGGDGKFDTVVVAQEETEEPVETEPVEDVPGKRGDPSDVHVRRVDTALEHLLEAEGEGEREFDYQTGKAGQ
jgi:hypothetical protein